jgi:putative DNA primase/helicase
MKTATPNGHVHPNLREALELEGLGYWVVPIYPKGAIVGDAIKTGKEPIGRAWGANRHTEATLRRKLEQEPTAGIGVCFGPGRGPDGRWLIDLEGDGPRAAHCLSIVLGTDQTPLTPSWNSTRGSHTLFVLEEHDALKLLELLAKAGGEEGAGIRAGVWHVEQLPDLEWRIGGRKADGTIKQLQSVIPPTIGDNGLPRSWNVEADRGILELPPSAFAVLESLAEWEEKRRAIQEELRATPPTPRPLFNITATNGDGIGAYAAQALRAECQAVATATEGSRNKTLNDAAFAAGTLVGAGALDESTAVLNLKAAARQCGLPEGEAARTIGSGMTAGKDKPRDLSGVHAVHKGESRPSSGPAVATSAAQKQGPPDFSGVEPRPITIDLLPVPALDPRMIPVPFRGWCEDIARRVCCPLEYVAATLIVVISALMGRRVALRPKRRDDWQVIPNLWGAVVGRPGWLKTPAVDEIMRPLKRLVADAFDAHAVALADWQAQSLVADAKRTAAKKTLEQAAKKGLADDDLMKLAGSASDADRPPEPSPTRYVINDCTIEKCGELLVDNPNGLLMFRDELIGFLKSFERQGHEGDRAFYLEGWNGNGSYEFDRIVRGSTHVKGLCLSVFGSIQPGPLGRYLRGAFGGEDCDGFIPRFQVMLYPDPVREFVNVDEFPDAKCKDQAYEVFTAIAEFDAATKGCMVDDDGMLPYVRFRGDAQGFFDDWRTDLENRLRDGSLSDVMSAHLSKFRSLMPSLALWTHMIDRHAAASLGPVSKSAAMAAAAWCDLLESHARRIYHSAMEGAVDDAARLAERIRESLPNPFTCRQVAQKGWTGLGTVDDVRRAVGILEDRGWVKVVETAPANVGGRPKEEIWINPRLQQAGGTDA